MTKTEEKVFVDEVEAIVDGAELEEMAAMVKEARKAKRKELLTKVKGKSIELAKYSVPAILTGIAMKVHYGNKPQEDTMIYLESELEEIPELEVEVNVEEDVTGE